MPPPCLFTKGQLKCQKACGIVITIVISSKEIVKQGDNYLPAFKCETWFGMGSGEVILLFYSENTSCLLFPESQDTAGNRPCDVLLSSWSLELVVGKTGGG